MSDIKPLAGKVHRILLLAGFSCALTADLAAEGVSSEVLERGREIYEASCVSCHGELGRGVKDAYEEQLVGDSSIPELSAMISDTMPEDDPESCTGKAAAAVAAYVHQTFYSSAAQLRLNPPKRRLARLTATQLRQSLADLYGCFDEPAYGDGQRGLRARYYNRDKKEDGDVKVERIDEAIDFDFGHDPPAEGINAKNYSVRWRGALLADESGPYEFIVRSTGAFIFYFGDYEREFINNYVQSADKVEFRKSVELTAGRVYPLMIEFHQRKRKTEQPPARISLLWRRPHAVEQVILPGHFVTDGAPGTFSLQAKLPPDDRSYGYERGIAVDRQWDASITAAAVEFATLVATELWPKHRKKEDGESNENREQLRRFLRELVSVAFRGPLQEDVQQLYIDDPIAASEDDAVAIRRVLLAALKSPRFLYPTLDADRDISQRAANRLSLVLFDSLPSDPWLRDQIKAGSLREIPQISDAAWRMVDDRRTKAKTRRFLFDWLNLNHFGEITKKESLFPGFDEAVVADLRDSLLAFLDSVVWSEESDFRELMLGDWSFASERLQRFYEEAPERSKTQLGPYNRYGLLSQPYLLSGLAYRDSTSPIHRGVFLLRYMLGRTLRPPNEAFTPLSPDLHPDLTTRERVALQTKPENCQVCHEKINGLGFVLEGFDAVGRHRTRERGRAIDASGRYTMTTGETISFAGPQQLARHLANSEDAHRAFIHRAFQYFVKQPPASFGVDTEDRLLDAFVENDFNIRQLLVDIAVVAATDVEQSHGQKTAVDGD